jgi:hypothetical protein
VYDSYRRPHVITPRQRTYWSSRSPALRTSSTTRTTVRPNWTGFERRTANATQRQQAREQRQTTREDRRQKRRDKKDD